MTVGVFPPPSTAVALRYLDPHQGFVRADIQEDAFIKLDRAAHALALQQFDIHNVRFRVVGNVACPPSPPLPL